MEDEASESCFCSETLDIILGIVPGELQQISTFAFSYIPLAEIKTSVLSSSSS